MQAQQSQFYEAMKAHEMEKLQKSGRWLRPRGVFFFLKTGAKLWATDANAFGGVGGGGEGGGGVGRYVFDALHEKNDLKQSQTQTVGRSR